MLCRRLSLLPRPLPLPLFGSTRLLLQLRTSVSTTPSTPPSPPPLSGQHDQQEQPQPQTQQPRPPPPRSLKQTLAITETIHSRKRVFDLCDLPASNNLQFKWADPVPTPSSAIAKHPFESKLQEIVPHPVQSWFRQTFLPIGYPDSVHPTYKPTHLLQFGETYLWSVVAVLCSQSMLESLGIASSAASTGAAVAIQWVLKDQIGELGKLIFINRFAKSLDSHPKTWKFIGEVASLSGAALQLFTIIYPQNFLLFAGLGYTMRSIHFSIYNSTHMTFTRNFALQGNVGDIVAKDDSQQTVAHLGGLVTGITLLSISHSPAFLFSCFFLIGPLHYWMTVKFLNATQFEVLSATKLLLLSDAYVSRNVVLTYKALEKEGNQIWFGEWIKQSWGGVKISKIGGSLDTVFASVGDTRDALEIMRDEDYLIGYRPDTQTFGITFHQDVSTQDVMKSIIHVTKLNQRVQHILSDDSTASIDFKALLRETLEWTRVEYPKFAVELEAKGWMTDSVFWGDEGNRCVWERSETEFVATAAATPAK